MSGIFNTLNTASKGLIAQQTALHTTSHNISNANTEGYSRQRVDLKADLAYNFAGVGQLGTGVKMEAIVRMVDDYVTKQIRQENGTLARFTTKSEIMEQVEIIFNEPSDTGLNFNLGEMFESWQELSKNPESLNSKTIVVEKSKTLAETLNHMANQINSLRDDTIGQIEKNILDFNSTVSQLDTLNKQIFNVSVKGQVPNDLLDQRDLLLKDLSSIANFDTSYDKYGRVSIKMEGEKVLGENADHEMSMISNIEENEAGDGYIVTISKGGDSLNPPVTYNTDDITNLKIGQVILNNKTGDFKEYEVLAPTIKSGQIMGNTEALNEIDKRKVDLDLFAKTMADAINEAHKKDSDGDGDGENIFDYNLDTAAGSIKINDNILKDNNLVIAGKTSNSPEGDGSRALDIAKLRNTKLDSGTTIEGAYRDIVTKIGISKEHADNMVSNQEILMQQLVLRRESTSGVSLDEEVSNLIKFQKSFDANAKVISVLTDMLDTLINRTGV